MLRKKHSFKRAVALMATVSVLMMTGCSNGEEVKDNAKVTTTVEAETTMSDNEISTTVEESSTTQVESSTEETTTTQKVTTTEQSTTTQEVTTTQKRTEKQTTTEKQTATKKNEQTTKKQETSIEETTTNHTHGYSSQVTNPTCTEQGYTTYTCSCGHSYVDNYVDASGHIIVIDPAVKSTYTSTGLTEGSHCSVCSEILVAQEVTPKSNIEWFETNNIIVRFADIKSTTYLHGEDSLYCDYQIITSSCKADKDIIGIDHNFSTSYDWTVAFTFTVKVKAITGKRYMNIPYEITNSKGEVLRDYYDGHTNLGRFNYKYSDTASYSKGAYYTFSDTIYFPAVPETYTITFLDPNV